MKTKLIPGIRQSAEDSFEAGLYCAESVVLALAKAQGIESDLLPKMATAFCGGMSRTCGALTGAMMGVSLAFGRNKASESVQDVYAATQKLVQDFEQAFGSRNCHELLNCDLGTPEGQHKFREENLRARCTQYTGKAAELAARLIFNGTALPIEPIEQLAEITQLLSACELPTSDISPAKSLRFFGCRSDGKLVGVIGLEVYGPVALLRSLAVVPTQRNLYLGTSLVAFAEAHASSLGVESVYLLTTTADTFFSRLGYLPAAREDAPSPIKTTTQFSDLCPASSSFMGKRLRA